MALTKVTQADQAAQILAAVAEVTTMVLEALAPGGSGVVIIRTLQTASATTGSPTTSTDGSYNIYKFTGSGSITF